MRHTISTGKATRYWQVFPGSATPINAAAGASLEIGGNLLRLQTAHNTNSTGIAKPRGISGAVFIGNAPQSSLWERV